MQFGLDWPSGSREKIEMQIVDGRQPMTIAGTWSLEPGELKSETNIYTAKQKDRVIMFLF